MLIMFGNKCIKENHKNSKLGNMIKFKNMCFPLEALYIRFLCMYILHFLILIFNDFRSKPSGPVV